VEVAGAPEHTRVRWTKKVGVRRRRRQ